MAYGRAAQSGRTALEHAFGGIRSGVAAKTVGGWCSSGFRGSGARGIPSWRGRICHPAGRSLWIDAARGAKDRRDRPSGYLSAVETRRCRASSAPLPRAARTFNRGEPALCPGRLSASEHGQDVKKCASAWRRITSATFSPGLWGLWVWGCDPISDGPTVGHELVHELGRTIRSR